MKKNRLKKKFLEELSNTPIVSSACTKLNLSRQTIYRWKEEDSEFAELFEIHLNQGDDNVNDYTESKLFQKIQEGNLSAIKYRLSNRKREYVTPRRPIDVVPQLKQDNALRSVEVRFINTYDKVDMKVNDEDRT